MSTFIGLNSRVTNALVDTTGLNTPGNYSNEFTASVLSFNVPFYECYHIVITNAPAAQAAQVWIGARQWGFTQPNNLGTEWAPPNGMLLTPGEEIYFLWNFAPSANLTIPMVTCWFRFDVDIPANKSYT